MDVGIWMFSQSSEWIVAQSQGCTHKRCPTQALNASSRHLCHQQQALQGFSFPLVLSDVSFWENVISKPLSALA